MTSLFTKTVLLLSAVVALAIGGLLLFFPDVLHHSVGIAEVSDINLRSELRAPSLVLLAVGALSLWAIWNSSWTIAALSAAAVIYFGYGGARMVGMLLDGLPNAALIQNTVIELVLGALCVLALRLQGETATQAA